MQVEYWPIDRPKPYPKNARKWSQRAVEKVAASIKEYGWRQPIVCDAQDVIVIGHLRLAGGKYLNLEQVPVHVARDLTPAQIRGLRLADNRLHEEAAWDTDLLAVEFGELKALDFQMESTGFQLAEIDRLLPQDERADECPPIPVEAVTICGNLWVCGSHRLLCGDATNDADVAKLMDGNKANLLATDPPYLVNYTGGLHPQSWSNSPQTRDKTWDDYHDPKAAIQFYESFLRLGIKYLADGGAIYQWHAALMQYLVHQAWIGCGLLVHQHIVWVKARSVLTHSHYMWQHEVAFYGWPRGKKPQRRPPANVPTVWQIDQKGDSDGIHPTQKPVELARRPIDYHTDENGICYDPFVGSGTTIIAAEILRRSCYGLEIEPRYCDVIVQRWQNFTGKQATLEGDGRTFAEIAEARKSEAA